MLKCHDCLTITDDDNHQCGLGRCHSCGSSSGSFSSSQLAKEAKARCMSCVAANRRRPYAPFVRIEHVDDIHTQLAQATGNRDIHKVHRLLAAGADPNMPSVDYKWLHKHCFNAALYNTDGSFQRTDKNMSAMETIVFCMSDCFLSIQDKTDLLNIMKLFIQKNADTSPALKLFEQRYGSV